jgi:hypothetical protein
MTALPLIRRNSEWSNSVFKLIWEVGLNTTSGLSVERNCRTKMDIGVIGRCKKKNIFGR